MAAKWLPLLLLLLLAPSPISAAEDDIIQNDFSKLYPAGALDCMNRSAKNSGCERGTRAQLNTCLCGNNKNFVTNAAQCLGRESPADASSVFDKLTLVCSESNTPLAVKKNEYSAAVKKGVRQTQSGSTETATQTMTGTTASGDATTTATTATTDAAETTNASSDDDDDDKKKSGGGISTGAIIGIAVAAAAVGIAAIAAATILLLRRRRRTSEESHPMLPHAYSGGPTTFPPTEPSPGLGMMASGGAGAYGFGSEAKSPWASPGQPGPPGYSSPGPGAAGKVWPTQSPPPSLPGAYAGPFAPPPAAQVAELPPREDPGRVYEMDGTSSSRPVSYAVSGAAEMPGSPPPPPTTTSPTTTSPTTTQHNPSGAWQR